MISISHWGLIDPEQSIPFCAPPIGMIAEIYRLRKVLFDNIASTTKGYFLSGAYLRLTA